MNRRVIAASLASLIFVATPALAHGLQNAIPVDSIHVRPAEARLSVRVDNDVGRALTVFADGKEIAVVPPGSRQRIAVNRDVRLLEARVGTRRIDRLKMDGGDRIWEVERPTETSVLVKNPLPISVQVTIDGRTRTLAAGATQLFAHTDVKSRTLVARRLSGQVIDRDTVRLSPFEDLVWQIDRPDQGLVEIQNRWSTSIQVVINGRVVGVLEAGQSQTFSARAGRAEIELSRLNRSGRVGSQVLDARIRIDRYDRSLVVTGPTGRGHYHDHGHYYGVR
jgi:hypothetical protein